MNNNLLMIKISIIDLENGKLSNIAIFKSSNES